MPGEFNNLVGTTGVLHLYHCIIISHTFGVDCVQFSGCSKLMVCLSGIVAINLWFHIIFSLRFNGMIF